MAQLGMIKIAEVVLLHEYNKCEQNPVRKRAHSRVYAKLTANNGLGKSATVKVIDSLFSSR